MKRFTYLRKEHVSCKPWWFWSRENVAFMNNSISETYSECFAEYYQMSIIEWFLLVFGIPVTYFIGLFVGGYLRKQDALAMTLSADSDYGAVTFYHKKTIEYFTLMQMLSGKDNEQ